MPDVPVQSHSRVVQRINDARGAHREGIIATDADGTLWTGDVGEDLFRAVLARGPILSMARDELHRLLTEFAVSTAGDDPAQWGERAIQAFLDDVIPETRICELIMWIFAGWQREAVDAFAQEVVERENVRGRLHPEVVRILSDYADQKIDIWVVSASPLPVVAQAIRCLPFAVKGVVGVTATYDHDVVQVAVESPLPYGVGKVEALRQRIGPRPIYAAFGDNVFDIPLLCESHVAVAVRPKDRLLRRAQDVAGLVQLELA